MASISYNSRVPADYSQFLAGTSAYDDEYNVPNPDVGTFVSASARVTNGGTATGRASIGIYDLDQGVNGVLLKSNGGNVPFFTEYDPRETLDLTLRYQVPDDQRMWLEVRIIDETTSPATILDARSFTVNSYAVPKVSDLSASQINISVS